MDKHKNDELRDARKIYNMPCPICSNTNYEWGKFVGRGFARDNWLSAGMPDARRCIVCGNVQVFFRPPGKIKR